MRPTPVNAHDLRAMLLVLTGYSRAQVEHALQEAEARVRRHRGDLTDKPLAGQDLVNFRIITLAQLPDVPFMVRITLQAQAPYVEFEHLFLMLTDLALTQAEQIDAGVTWFRLHGVEVR